MNIKKRKKQTQHPQKKSQKTHHSNKKKKPSSSGTASIKKHPNTRKSSSWRNGKKSNKLPYGTLIVKRQGFGFVLPPKRDSREIDHKKYIALTEDVFIPHRDIGTAIHGDFVAIEYVSLKGRRTSGRIIQVLVPVKNEIIGRYIHDAKPHVVPLDDAFPYIIRCPRRNDIPNGTAVIVDFTRSLGDGKTKYKHILAGTIRETLEGEKDYIDFRMIADKYAIPLHFPPSVHKYVEDHITESLDFSNRKDIRDQLIVTIDGADAKDLDDAVSITTTQFGWRLSVHIADVSHYVKEDSPLDKEALQRGTSVYLINRVVPMLPPMLSNNVCSLNPHEDTLTMTVVMDIDRNGNRIASKIFPSVIRSKFRLTYDIVEQILCHNNTDYPACTPLLKELEQAALALLKERRKRGSIEFELPDIHITIGSHGRVTDIAPRHRSIAHQIIEECMLAANRTVAEFLEKKQVPFLYRLHDVPNEEKLEPFALFLRKMNVPFPKEHPQPIDFQKVLAQFQNTPFENIISAIMLRTMMRAVYAHTKGVHFGLAFDTYCHFTSPIRRYPDLLVHRQLKKLLAGKSTDIGTRHLAHIGKISSVNERTAMEAERELNDIKAIEFMADKVGNKYTGIINGVTDFGFFVSILPYRIEGLVALGDLTDDEYIFIEDEFALHGKYHGTVYQIGQMVRVMVAKVDIVRNELDLQILKPND